MKTIFSYNTLLKSARVNGFFQHRYDHRLGDPNNSVFDILNDRLSLKTYVVNRIKAKSHAIIACHRGKAAYEDILSVNGILVRCAYERIQK